MYGVSERRGEGMKTLLIKVQIDCVEKHCANCEHRGHGLHSKDFCHLYRISLLFDHQRGDVTRCEQCLNAEVKE